MNMNPVVHFEMPVKDQARVKNFYESVFGWTMQQMGPDMGNYILATTTPVDEKTQRPTQPGAINGGFFEKTEDNQYPSVVISISDIRVSMKQVEGAGGKVLGGQKPGEPDDIPGVGLYAAFLDTEGNRVGMLQPTGMP